MTAQTRQSERPVREREGHLVQSRRYDELEVGDVVQHYSKWEQTWGDSILREVTSVGPVADGHRLLIGWRDPDGEQEDYESRERPQHRCDVIVGVPEPLADYETAIEPMTEKQTQAVVRLLIDTHYGCPQAEYKAQDRAVFHAVLDEAVHSRASDESREA